MDIRKPHWHSQLALTGIGSPINHSGSILSILGEILKDLSATNPRALASGEREIIIRIRERPYGSAKESMNDLDRVIEVQAGLDDSTIEGGPQEGEHFHSYVARLQTQGLNESAAIMIAADWFQTIPPVELQLWLNDARAKRFRQLNSSREAFDKAGPTEYAQLKDYVLERFPSFCETLTFRTA